MNIGDEVLLINWTGRDETDQFYDKLSPRSFIITKKGYSYYGKLVKKNGKLGTKVYHLSIESIRLKTFKISRYL